MNIVTWFTFRLFGDYETLSHGRTADALVDFTGGVAEKLELQKLGVSDTHSQLELFNKVKDALENHALVNCNIDVSLITCISQYESFGY